MKITKQGKQLICMHCWVFQRGLACHILECHIHELTCNCSRNTQSQSSQLAEPLWTDPGLKSGIIVHELVSTLKKKGAGRE